MINELPAAPDPANDLPAVFNQKAAAFVLAQKAMVPQINAAIANLSSIAAGGAYAIPYKWGTSVNGSSGYATGGILVGMDSNGPNVVAVFANITKLAVDTRDIGGASVGALLSSTVAGNTSTVKGHMRLVKQGDPSVWARLSVTAFALSNTYYGYFDVALIDSSSTNPFAPGDSVLLFFQRTGDKGDKGDAAPIQNFPSMYVRDEKASNTGGGNLVGTVMTRVLNTVKLNTIPGASLSSSLVSLPAGTYEYVGSVPAYCVNAFRAQLWNSTDGVYIDNGTSEYSDAASGRTPTRSIVRGSFTIASSKNIALRMVAMNGGAGNLGVASNDGNVEVYSELWIKKVA